ncbi:hypothetical protein Ddc_20324 [Ditylenchus destructor]|nr:hypothetical protein Ddc_20324 [Ditylenchus destructor]
MAVYGLTYSNNISFIVQDVYSFIIIICSLASVVLFSRILYLYASRRNAVFKPTMCMNLFMTLSMIGMALLFVWRVNYLFNSANKLGIFKLGYFISPTNTTQAIYYWTNKGYLVATGTSPLTVFFLTLERCLVIQLGLRFSFRMSVVLFSVSLVFCPAISTLINLYYAWAVWPYKMSTGTLNTFSCVYLIWKLRSRSPNAGAVRKTRDYIVRNTIIMEICLEFLPNLVLFFVTQFQLESLFSYTTSLSIATQCLNSAVVAIMYTIKLANEEKRKAETAKNALKSSSHTNKITFARNIIPVHNFKF